VRALRERFLELKPKQMAQKIGIAESTIENWERGGRPNDNLVTDLQCYLEEELGDISQGGFFDADRFIQLLELSHGIALNGTQSQSTSAMPTDTSGVPTDTTGHIKTIIRHSGLFKKGA